MRYFVALALIASSLSATEPVRLEVKGLSSGSQQAVFNVYASADAAAPIATETRTIEVDANRNAMTPWGAFPAGAERWIAVSINGIESKRVRIDTTRSLPIAVQVAPSSAIWAGGMIESASQGFKFPDGSIQTSAATVSGGVPSVNGIGAAVTINSGGTASVSTVGSTITVSAPAFGTPVGIGTANSAGVSTSVARADHVHDHGNLAGGSLHAVATSGAAGFMSATDKSKLDAVVQYAKTVVVSPVGTSVQNGTALRSALANLSSPSSTNPYLVKIEPGIYDVGSTSLSMRSFVDIEGSGEDVTTIQGSASAASAFTSTAAAIIGAGNSELRRVTIKNTTSGANGTAFYADASNGAGTVHLSQVTMNSSGATTTSSGVVAVSTTVDLFHVTVASTAASSASAAGLLTSGATLTVASSSITASGVGGTNEAAHFAGGSTVSLKVSSLTATGAGTTNTALFLVDGTANVMGCSLTADTASTRIAVITGGVATNLATITNSTLASSGGIAISQGTGSVVAVASSMLDGTASGGPVCVYVFDGSFAATSC